mmetsp:Transcript_15026/g.28194  ORF Transcript_15026/g.28194 Transcript_15026/m.28194 type:complete len:233 (-) Transcript_15026:7-705(-)
MKRSVWARTDAGFEAFLHRRYHKLVSLLDFMAATGTCTAEAVVDACELFAQGGQRQWLKVAGEAKAQVIDSYLRLRHAPDQAIVAEFGSFVGYSCVRMASHAGCARIISLESDAVHVLVARHIIDLSGLSGRAEIWPGLAHDVLDRLVEDWGSGGTDFAFMDHRGTRFDAELVHLQRIQALRGRVLADNTLKPGAPAFLWLLYKGDCDVAVSWSLPEFLTQICEDWMTCVEV